MASSPGPGTPEETPRRMMTSNRSFTLPAKVSTPAKAGPANPEIGSTEGIETLYHHPNAKLVKFTASARSGAKIPWESPTERTIAAGELEIYRVPGSVSFLHSGSVLHTIMARSNCWCVDGVSKFVMRILMDTYYRIELPGETEEDLEHVEKFKVTLQKVCFYERTPCPFVRTFNIDEPEEQEVVRKGKRRKSTGPAKKWKLEGVWRPEGWVEPEKVSEESASGSGSPEGSDDESDAAPTPMEPEESIEETKPVTPTTPMRQRALAALRSASAPQSPAPISTPPSRLRTRVDVDGTIEVTEPIQSESNDRETPRLRTFQAIPTDMPPSPPDSSAGLDHTNDDPVRNDVEAPDERIQPDLDDRVNEHDASHDTETGPRTEGVPIAEHVQYYDGMTVELPQQPPDVATVPSLSEQQPQAQIDSTTDILSAIDNGTDGTLGEPQRSDLPSNIAMRVEDLDLASSPPPPAAEDFASSSSRAVESEVPEVDIVDETLADGAVFEQETPSTLPAYQLEIEEPVEDHSISSKAVEFVIDEQHNAAAGPQTPQGLQSPIEFVEDEEALQEQELPPALTTEEDLDDRPSTPPNRAPGEDPYAAIQARIMARRSLSGTVSFHPSYKSPTRQSTSSTSSTATISSSKSSLSRRSQPTQHQQAFAHAMVKKAYNTFLGPPAHLVAIMLRIAARFANGAFGVESMFYVESPIDSPRKVPGSYHLSGDGEQVEDLDSDFDLDDEELEDDFGVPLNSPLRLVQRTESHESGAGSVRERARRRWDDD